MASTESKTLTYRELVGEYPILEEWFANPVNTTAQLQEGKRLMSAREKLALFGGEKQVRDNLAAVIPGWKIPYTILLACRQEPMVAYEISKFGEDVGVKMYAATIIPTIKDLEDEGCLSSVPGLIYIIRLGGYADRFHLNENREGYLTTEEGLRQTALHVQRKKRKGLARIFVPAPKPL